MSIDTEKKNMKALTSSKQTSSPSNNRTIGPFLRQILTSSSSMTHQKLRAHQAIKKLVQVGFGVLFLFVFCICGFSILSVLQQSAQWFPDATTVTYHGNTSIEIQHTSVVKLHIHLEPSPTHEEDVMANTSSTTYASCSNTWHGLSMIDYGFLAEAAYFDPSSDAIEKFLTRIFTNDSQIQIRLPPENTKTGSKLDFYEVFFPNLNTSVLSVKGTDIWRFTDFVEDVKMFLEPVIFTILSGIFPTIRIWPDVTFSTLIELYSEIVALFGLEHEFWYYNELLEYIEGIQDRQVVLTGHSMGGGIARFVGSITGKTSITFSPPGFVQSYSKLVHHVKGQKTKVDRNKLHHLSVAIIPEYDPITMIDAQSGLIQRISCNTPHLSMQLSCHMLEGTLCNLIEHCGDSRRRVNGCKFEHRISSLKEDIGPILVSLFSPEILGALTIGTMILFSVALHGKSISSSSPTTHTSTSSYGKNGFTILTEMLSPPKLPPQQRRIRHLLAKAKQKIG
jgi:lipase ATG15